MQQVLLCVKECIAQYSTLGMLTEDDVLELADKIVTSRLAKGEALTSPKKTAQYLKLKLQSEHNEKFGVLFLDSQHRVIAFEVLFSGTIDAASVYPRVVLEKTIAHGAAAVIFTHNHPSGIPEPSSADRALTIRLSETLKIIDVRVLDHVVVGTEGTVSFAERGWL